MTKTHAPRTRNASRSTHRVLVVEDHPLTRSGIVRLIASQDDFEVSGEAGNLEAAYKSIAKDPPDVITLDLTLGHESSLAHFERIRELAGDVPILVISMHDEMTHGYRAVSEGANGYVQKDAQPEAVLAALRTVVNGGTAVSPRLAALFVSATRGRRPDGNTMSLSRREFEVYQLIGIGLATREIAAKLGISARTVEAHKENMKKKLHLKSAAELARHAAQSIQRD